MAQQLWLWLLALVILYANGAQGSQHLYDCPDSGVHSSSKCNQTCFRALGNALIGLYGGLSGFPEPPPWNGVQPGSMCLPCINNSTKSGVPVSRVLQAPLSNAGSGCCCTWSTA
jgi:hypothetical protein